MADEKTVGIGCSNMNFAIAGAKRADLFSATEAGGTAQLWADSTYSGWAKFGALIDDMDVIWIMLCAHEGTTAEIAEYGRDIIAYIRQRRGLPWDVFTGDIFVSGINGYDPPRDDGWPFPDGKGAIATIASNEAAAILVVEELALAGPDMASIELLPSECIKDGFSPHPNKAGQKKLGALIVPFDFYL